MFDVKIKHAIMQHHPSAWVDQRHAQDGIQVILYFWSITKLLSRQLPEVPKACPQPFRVALQNNNLLWCLTACESHYQRQKINYTSPCTKW